ncbi:helix-turn-helix domain-containing protein [Natrinema ejinorense]|uniref:MarR family transcriptional regulator n=1 Tax=Natrinema ejinorense TaxID=373386 RepID=A0A2A5QU07_9EURY|nr:MarR family transcriptional regulator [Natrinema ejinorense]PCR90310.1 MarR family transcriptional regulator [Natrinema ejinorense]
MTQADDRILETLADSDLILSPRILSANTDYSRHYLSTRLGKLRDAGLVDRVDEGLYRITDRGTAYLEGNLSADVLENENI